MSGSVSNTVQAQALVGAVAGLSPSTLHYWRLRYVTASGTFTSATQTFTTASVAGTAPVVTVNPASITRVAGVLASFTAAATGSPTPTVQWQARPNSAGTFVNIGGATSTTYSFTPAAGDSGKQFRAVFTNSVSSATTGIATLTVTPVNTDDF